MSKNIMKHVLFALCALALGTSTAFGMAGTKYGMITMPGGHSYPAKEDLSFIAFINGNDAIIHTENAYNAALGTGNGYITQGNKGIWLLNFANFESAKPGDQFSVIFTSHGQNLRATYNADVPPGLTEADVEIALRPVTAPLPPTGLQAQRSSEGVAISWAGEQGLTYRVYRADLPSGANNGASRGIYTKVAENVTSSTFVDTQVDASRPYWYLVVAQDKNGVLSGHSGEIRVVESAPTVKNGLTKVNGLTLQSVDALQQGEVIGESVPPVRH